VQASRKWPYHNHQTEHKRADLLFQSVAPAESFNRPGDRLVAANDGLVGANNSLAAANDSLVEANNKKGKVKQ